MMKRQYTADQMALPIESSRWVNRIDWLLVTAVVVTFVNGLIISLWVFPAVSGPAGLVVGRSDGWVEIAENILLGNGFVHSPDTPSATVTGQLAREPIYALVLASILAAFGELDPFMMLLQILINSLTCLVLYFIARKTFNRRVALLACFLYAVYPFASWYVSRVAYETLLGFLVALLTLGLIYLFERLSLRRALMVGFLLGVTVLCKGTFLLFPFALLPGLMLRFGAKNRNVISCWLIVTLMMLALLSPWIVRNYLISREFVPVSSHGGIVFLLGNKVIESYSLRENTAGDLPGQESDKIYYEIQKSIMTQHPDLSHAQVEVWVDKQLVRMAIEDVIARPLKFLEKILKGLIFVWFLMDTGLKSTALLFMQGPLVLLCAVGIFFASRAQKQVLPLLILLVYFVLIQTAFLSLGRFSYPMVFILIAFAAYALEAFRSKYLHGQRSLALRW
jgi:4-amino-4-deoxy-L-arabinose transferase-like glycosyltransferase